MHKNIACSWKKRWLQPGSWKQTASVGLTLFVTSSLALTKQQLAEPKTIVNHTHIPNRRNKIIIMQSIVDDLYYRFMIAMADVI